MLGISRGLLRGARRGVLTTKKGPIGYYKGRGAAPTGYHSRKGRYIIVPSKIPEIVVPDLSTTELRPYVGRGGEYVKVAPPTAEDYMPLIRQQGRSQARALDGSSCYFCTAQVDHGEVICG
eukprot:Opistho-2@84281